MLDNNKNFRPGLLVDDPSVRSPDHFNLYLQSHSALKGTARPCHYFAIENGMNFGAVDLQQISFNLWWTFATALTPISCTAPAYYADRLADRGRCYLRPLLILRHPQRPTDTLLWQNRPNAAHATEKQKADHVCDHVDRAVASLGVSGRTPECARTRRCTVLRIRCSTFRAACFCGHMCSVLIREWTSSAGVTYRQASGMVCWHVVRAGVVTYVGGTVAWLIAGDASVAVVILLACLEGSHVLVH